MSNTFESLLGAIAELGARIKGLEARIAALEGGAIVTPPSKREVVLGGEVVELLPLSPKDWIAALNDLPVILWTYLSKPESELSPDDLERAMGMAKTHIVASLASEARHLVDRASVPEISAAFRRLLEVNGLDQALGQFFRKEGIGTQP